MSTYNNARCSLWPRQARPQGAMPKGIVTGLCVGIIVGIATNAVLTELQPSASAQVAAPAREGTAKPVLAAASMSTQQIVAARPTPSQVATDIRTVGTPRAAANIDDERVASTDGRGGEAAIDRAAAAAAVTAASMLVVSAPTAAAPTAAAPTVHTPLVERAEGARPAAEPAVTTSEPAAKPAGRPPRVAQKKQKKPTSYSAQQTTPFFPFFGRGNGLFFGQRG